MSSDADADLILTLNNISTQFNRCFTIIIFIFGSIGNILNCLILSQRKLRSNPCAFLFLTSSIAHQISIFIGVSTRILAGWNIDPTGTVTWICKCRAFLVFTSRTIAFWLIVLATIDRWLLSSMNANRRHMSTLKNAKRGTLIIIFLAICLYIQLLYCYEANLLNTPLKCYEKTITCRLVTGLTYSLITVLLPLFLMLLFSLKTISNIRQVRQRIQPAAIIQSITQPIRINTNIRPKQKKIDHHLLVMLIVEVIFLTLFTIPQSIDKLYSTFTIEYVQSEYYNAIHWLIYNIVLLFSFLASAMPFYIYTFAGGSVYRNALWNLLKNSYRQMKL